MIDPDGSGGGPIISNKAPDGRLHLDDLRRAAGAGRRELEGLPAAGQLRLQHAGEFQESSSRPTQGSPLYTQRDAWSVRKASSSTTRMNDKLPAVSWIIPTSFQSEHPDYMPADGAAFVASKIDAIAANPDVWAKTVFILNYDENDGHLRSCRAARLRRHGTPHEFVGGLADRRRIPRAVHHRFAVDRRRLGLQPAVRSHVGAAVSGKIHRRARTEHHRLAQAHVWRSDFGVPVWRGRSAAPPLPDTSGPLTLAKFAAANLPKPVVARRRSAGAPTGKRQSEQDAIIPANRSSFSSTSSTSPTGRHLRRAPDSGAC